MSNCNRCSYCYVTVGNVRREEDYTAVFCAHTALIQAHAYIFTVRNGHTPKNSRQNCFNLKHWHDQNAKKSLIDILKTSYIVTE